MGFIIFMNLLKNYRYMGAAPETGAEETPAATPRTLYVFSNDYL